MLSKDILDHIVNGNSTEARGMTVNLLQAKLSELMAQKYDEIAPTVFGETKKEQKKAEKAALSTAKYLWNFFFKSNPHRI